MAMTTTQTLAPAACSSSILNSSGCVKTESSLVVQAAAEEDTFPAGLRVLVVDDDPICLLILDRMLRRCQYQVTTCGRATEALDILRKNRNGFDLVISDVCMPDMDGFKLLELLGLEMDLPVIMMSANGETSAVMKGIKHGACDYLLKPVRMEELRNIWQHVVRKKWGVSRPAGSNADDRSTGAPDDGNCTSSAHEGHDKHSKKRKDVKEAEEDPDLENDDPSTTKKARVVWSVDLHQQFVNAVNQLGIDKAVPKRILEIMNVQGLTRENVASHLQKYRLYLKRISGVAHQSCGLNSSLSRSTDFNFGGVGTAGLGGLGDMQTLAGPGQLSSQALVSMLQAGLLGRSRPPANNSGRDIDTSILLQMAGSQGANTSAFPPLSYGQAFSNNFGNGGADLKQFPGPGSVGSFAEPLDKGLSSVHQQQHATTGDSGSPGRLNTGNFQSPRPKHHALALQALQQQGSESSSDVGGFNFPSDGYTGHHRPINDTGTWVGSGLNASVSPGIDNAATSRNAGVRVGPSSSAVVTGSSSNLLGVPGRTTGDISILHSSDARSINFPSLNSSSISSSFTSSGLDKAGAVRISNMGSSSSSVSDVLSQSILSSKLPLGSGLKHGQVVNAVQKQQDTWQGFGVQEFGQAHNAMSLRVTQALTGNQGITSLNRGEEECETHNLGLNSGLSSDFSIDGGCMKAPVIDSSLQVMQTMSHNGRKARESNFQLQSKLDAGFLPGPVSEDLLNIILKQQQDGLAFTEGELGAVDGYSLNSLYMK